MAVAYYFDVHVPRSISDQLRQRGVDVLAAIENGHATADDEVLFERASSLGRVVFTQDIRFKARAERWQAEGRKFAGLVFGHPMRGTIGEYVRDLELIAGATDITEWQNTIARLPL
jgi:hypothetical protein